MRLRFLPTNQAWVFAFGDSLVRLHGFAMFFPTRAEAVSAARELGITESTVDGGFIK